jgi:glycosyltransferase involved in cell wall biosynthesis
MKGLLLHILILSRLGRKDGGRETWIYNFLPVLLAKTPAMNVMVFGIKDEATEDVTVAFRHAALNIEKKRFVPHQFEVKKKPYPVFFQMWRRYFVFAWTGGMPRPHLMIGLGIHELVMLLTIPRKSAKRIIWLRGIFLSEKSNWFPRFLLPSLQAIEIFLLKKVDLVLANGSDIAEHYEARGLPMPVVQNGVDLNRWRLDPPRLNRQLHVAFVGRLTEIKGIVEFLQMVRALKAGEAGERFVFHIVGEGPYSKTEDFIGTQESFCYHGGVENSQLPFLTKDFDVCVALTVTGHSGGGGTSNALLEQMAAGRVIVAWDNEIFRQVLDDASGFLVPQGDVKNLAEAMLKILDDPAAAAIRAQQARRVAESFSIEGQVEKFISLIEKMKF